MVDLRSTIMMKIKRLAYNRQIQECMLRNPFQCDICNHTYHMASKSKHLRSNKHINNAKQIWVFIILGGFRTT